MSVSTLVISLDNFDFMTSFSAVAANLNNIGRACRGRSGVQLFHDVLPEQDRLIFDMLARELELFPMLVLLSTGNLEAQLILRGLAAFWITCNREM